ncbi:hypothetical protein BKA62DRAFT_704710 [Auriculariales sp. MPI-PUGE-AT-0066]|nr:hypothetical protein BKA62DRAFT_704710 [Auriculariales sp. MPI-PUGE-AT-0066]
MPKLHRVLLATAALLAVASAMKEIKYGSGSTSLEPEEDEDEAARTEDDSGVEVDEESFMFNLDDQFDPSAFPMFGDGFDGATWAVENPQELVAEEAEDAITPSATTTQEPAETQLDDSWREDLVEVLGDDLAQEVLQVVDEQIEAAQEEARTADDVEDGQEDVEAEPVDEESAPSPHVEHPEDAHSAFESYVPDSLEDFENDHEVEIPI